MRLKHENNSDLLAGAYTSSVTRIGNIKVQRLPADASIERLTVRKLTSQGEDDYLGVSIERALIKDDQFRLRKFLDHQKHATLLANRETRDGINHHMTVISPPEYKKLSEKNRAYIENKLIAIASIGLGQVKRKGVESYYIIVSSPHAQYLRMKVRLPHKDFHITLGFDPHDIHNHPKDVTTRM